MLRGEIAELLFRTPARELAALARQALAQGRGAHVHVRGLIEFSNRCTRNCRYCGLRAANAGLPRYLLTQEEIMRAAGRAVGAGADSIVLQSGEGAANPEWIADLVQAISSRLKVPVTLSVGECPDWQYRLWREAGASRFLLKHETADASLYARLHPGWSLADRLKRLRVLADLGYEVGTGFIIGLPGQDPASLVDDILLARELKVAMCGAGPYLPQAGTPLAASPAGSPGLALRVLSVLRLALPWANLPATTALASLLPGRGQREGLLAGANVLMPSFTPAAAAARYRIYDRKLKVDMAAARAAIAAARSGWPDAEAAGRHERAAPGAGGLQQA